MITGARADVFGFQEKVALVSFNTSQIVVRRKNQSKC